MKTVTRSLVVATLGLAALAFSGSAHADEGCDVVDFQGAPIEVCPPPDPGPVCWLGWFLGATIVVCGDELPEGATYHKNTPWAGQPIVALPTAAADVAPVAVVEAASEHPADLDLVTDPQENLVGAPKPVWLLQLLALLAANGGGF
jgi:hypothetical protein